MRSSGFLLAVLAVVACGNPAAPSEPDTNAGSAGVSAAGGGAAGSGASGMAAGGHVGVAGVANSGGGASGGMTGLGGVGGSAGGAGNPNGGSSGTGGQALSLVGSGTITYERWEGVKGEAVSLIPTDDAPDVTLALSIFQMPDDVGQDFGARLRGFLTPPLSGDYTFFISCDDNGELNLSSDETPANKQRIAYVSGSPAWTDYVEWNKFPTQKSQVVSLLAGKRYYVEALLKEDIAEDHLAVGWTKPGDIAADSAKAFEIIPGKQLSPIE